MFTKIGALLMADGNSRRAGEKDLLFPVEGEPMIRHCVRGILDSGIDDIVVVLGHDRWRIAAALSGLPVCMVVNAGSKEKKDAESIRIGISAIPKYVTGVLMERCGYPLVMQETYRILDRHHDMHPGRILLPVRNGRGGYPILFPEPLCRPATAEMPLSRLVKKYRDHVSRIEVDDPGVYYNGDSEPVNRRRITIGALYRRPSSPVSH